MKRIIQLFVITAIFFVTSSALPVFAADAGKPIVLRIAAQQPGLNFYGFSTTLAKLVEQYGPAGSKLEVIPRGGSMSNQTTLDQGKCELAYTHVATAMWAWNGLPEVYGKYGQHKNIRFISPGYWARPYITVVARREYVQKSGLDTLEKMLLAKTPPRFIMKPQGSNVIPVFEGILKSVGKTWDEFKAAGNIIQVPQAQFSEMLKDARADVYVDAVATNHPGLTEIIMTNDLVWVPYSQKILDYMAKNYSMPTEIIPPASKGGYDGIPDEGYASPGDGQALLGHKDLPDEAAYLLAKLIVEKAADFRDDNGVLKNWNPSTDHQSLNLEMPVHPGAARYYKEKGWIK